MNPSGVTGQPDIIILCTWLGGATTKRIQKYTLGYHKLWPKSVILAIRTTAAEYAFSGASALRRKLRPALREIRRIMARVDSPQKLPPYDHQSGSGILLHMFSNGGANIATQLVASMNGVSSILGQAETLPMRQVVLDSCPADPGINNTYAAASHSISTTHPLRPLFCATLYLVVAGIAGLEAVGLRRCLGKAIREQLNDPKVVSPGARRLYLISEADAIVDFREVLAHRHQALSKGIGAETVVFKRAGHCCLVLEDERAYWGAIESCWARGRREGTESRVKIDSITCREQELVAEGSRALSLQIRSRL